MYVIGSLWTIFVQEGSCFYRCCYQQNFYVFKTQTSKKGAIRKDIKTHRIRSGLDIRLQKIVK